MMSKIRCKKSSHRRKIESFHGLHKKQKLCCVVRTLRSKIVQVCVCVCVSSNKSRLRRLRIVQHFHFYKKQNSFSVRTDGWKECSTKKKKSIVVCDDEKKMVVFRFLDVFSLSMLRQNANCFIFLLECDCCKDRALFTLKR